MKSCGQRDGAHTLPTAVSRRLQPLQGAQGLLQVEPAHTMELKRSRKNFSTEMVRYAKKNESALFDWLTMSHGPSEPRSATT